MKKITITAGVLGLIILWAIIMIVYPSTAIHKHKVLNYDVAYITSDVQEYTHDLKIAHLENNIYIQVPDDYDEEYVDIVQTGHETFFYIMSSKEKVSDKGYKKA
jgi:hypothetical protein